MSDFRPRHNEKGIVLVMALLITSILFIMAFTLAYNMSSYLKATSAVREKTQVYYSTYAALELLREDMAPWNSNCFPPNWCGRLGDTGGDVSVRTYQDITTAVSKGVPKPTFPAGGGPVYKVYLRDNEDGDDNYKIDSDQIVLASVESFNPATQTKTTIEAMLILAGTDSYMQQGKGADRGSLANEQGANTMNKRQDFIRATP